MSEDDDVLTLSIKKIKTTHGCIQGRLCESVYGDFYFSFEGIPFAQPPVGPLRFRAPVPKKPWFTLWDCTRKVPKPLQHCFQTGETSGSEDCLYLNFYVKEFCSKKLLPIMVFLYPGGYESGDASRTRCGPDYFMMEDVVLVTIAYRLAALGFLSLEDPAVDCPGNAGLKDQLLALKWVKDNARNFNGDPDNITIFGCSAGASSAHFLSMSPKAKGLFHKIILQSGTAYCSWALSTLKCMAQKLAKALGYVGPMNDVEIFNFLQKVDGEKLVKVYLLTKEENMIGHLYSFGPVVEPYRSSHCLLPYIPEILGPKAWSNKIPMLIGGSSFEGLFMKTQIEHAPHFLEGIRRNSRLLLPYILRENYSKKKQNKHAKSIHDAHFGDKEINVENSLTFCEFISYLQFWHPIHRTILSRQWYSCAPTYVYRFDFDSPYYNFSRMKYSTEKQGVTHGDELSYMFHSVESWKLDLTTCEYRTIRRMIALWTTFAECSNPNRAKEQNISWEPVEQDENMPLRCLNISRELKFIVLPEYKKLRIWNDLYKESFDYDDDDDTV